MDVTKAEIIEVLIDDTLTTLTAKAEKLGYANVSGLTWRLNNDPTITQDLADLCLQVAKGDTHVIIKKLAAKAKSGDMQAMNTFLKYTGLMVDTTKVIGDKDNPLVVKLDDGMTEEEVRNIAQAVLEKK
jgi:hypothetical protein